MAAIVEILFSNQYLAMGLPQWINFVWLNSKPECLNKYSIVRPN